MKRHSAVFCLLLFSSAFSTAQIRYKDGYFVSHDNQTTTCLIYHIDWLNNPSNFKYKLKEDGEVLTAGLIDVKEFGLEGLKFINASVRVDTSSQDARNLDDNRNPEWKDVRAFLKVVLEGKASLYSYRTPRLERYFYAVDGSPIEQLVYKEFLMKPKDYVLLSTPDKPIGKNLTYLQQLKMNVSCGSISDDDLKKIRYEKVALWKYFQKYNSCHGAVSTKRTSSSKINLIISPGVGLSTFKISYPFWHRESERSRSFQLGFTVEDVLPFNNGKWSVIFEPTFQSYTSANLVDYRSIEVPLGVRHGFFLKTDLKLFLNGFLVFDKPLKYKASWSNATAHTAKASSLSFAAGLGVSARRFSIEARKYFPRTIQGQETTHFFVYEKFSLIAGYRIR